MAESKPRFVTTTVEVEGRTEQRVVELPTFDLEPWGDDAALTHVGARALRVDAALKATGRPGYTADLRRPHQAYAAIVRSHVARGRVTRLDATAARALPGVLDVLVHADCPPKTRLFTPEITYHGQPLAAVCAESPEIAERAAAMVVVEVEKARHSVTVAQATAPDAAPVRPGIASNLLFNEPRVRERGDVAAGFAAADVVIEREVRTPCVLHSALEPHSAVCEWDGDRLTVWESTQGIFRVRDNVAKALGIPLTDVRVICEAMGGGFGAKNYAGAHTYIAALLAKRLGRPVMCAVDRHGEQVDTGNRPASVQRVKMGATRDGRLTAIEMLGEVPLGIGGWEGGPGEIYHEMYACPNVRTHETFAFVNTAAMAAFRAPGHAEGAVGLEIGLNALAAALAMDPLEFRRRNVATHDQKKNRPYTGNRLAECYDEGARRFGWTEWQPAGRPRRRAATPTPPTTAAASPASRTSAAASASARRSGLPAAARRATPPCASIPTAAPTCSPARRTSVPAPAPSSRRSPPRRSGIASTGCVRSSATPAPHPTPATAGAR
jgi:xanthine dehydrogenase YagR molybdenum-binding subunit